MKVFFVVLVLLFVVCLGLVFDINVIGGMILVGLVENIVVLLSEIGMDDLVELGNLVLVVSFIVVFYFGCWIGVEGMYFVVGVKLGGMVGLEM